MSISRYSRNRALRTLGFDDDEIESDDLGTLEYMRRRLNRLYRTNLDPEQVEAVALARFAIKQELERERVAA